MWIKCCLSERVHSCPLNVQSEMHISPGGFERCFLILQVGNKHSPAQGCPSKLIKVNSATTLRQFKAKGDLKSSHRTTGVQDNLAHSSQQNTLSMFAQQETKSSPASLVPTWEEGTLLQPSAIICSFMPGHCIVLPNELVFSLMVWCLWPLLPLFFFQLLLWGSC